jgi:hypothetical protein
VKKQNLIEIDSGDEEKPKKKKTKINEKAKAKKGKKKGWLKSTVGPPPPPFFRTNFVIISKWRRSWEWHKYSLKIHFLYV